MFLFLSGYSRTVKKESLGSVPYFLTMVWFGLTIPGIQISVLAYCRFGARKILKKEADERKARRGVSQYLTSDRSERAVRTPRRGNHTTLRTSSRSYNTDL